MTNQTIKLGSGLRQVFNFLKITCSKSSIIFLEFEICCVECMNELMNVLLIIKQVMLNFGSCIGI